LVLPKKKDEEADDDDDEGEGDLPEIDEMTDHLDFGN